MYNSNKLRSNNAHLHVAKESPLMNNNNNSLTVKEELLAAVAE
jgi:hypothetical protein|tara:strand:+ start:362 stop:490 length:129 start_codon:yes stop_codon:yes gene_type:complete